ncbi:hypothetical protein AKJ51_05040, partial [candidate division MSBL1 archaeon SCGC-AAA382A20]
EFDISSLVVLDGSGIVGVFSEKHLKEEVVAKGISIDEPVEKVMTTDPPIVSIGTDIKNVTKVMAKRRTKYVLVEEDDEVVGILTFGDLIGMERRKLETYISRE